jgi:hypothetical protein
MDRKIPRKHLIIMRKYIEIHFTDYYTFALRKFRRYYETGLSPEECRIKTNEEIDIYKKKDLLERITEFNRKGTIKKRNYTPRKKVDKPQYNYEIKYTEIIFE